MSKANPADNIVLVLIDWQERLFSAMPEGLRDENLKNATHLKWLADQLGIPVVVSEQYPKGLGPTLAALQPVDAIAKTSFSAMDNPEFVEKINALGKRHVLLSGMETHICVSQTAHDLCEANFPVWVVADACLSRKKTDWKISLQRMVVDGSRITTTEAIIFEILEKAEGDLFKALAKRIK